MTADSKVYKVKVYLEVKYILKTNCVIFLLIHFIYLNICCSCRLVCLRCLFNEIQVQS